MSWSWEQALFLVVAGVARYIILPSQERRVPARALLDRLGATIRTEGRLLVGEISDSSGAAEAEGDMQ